MNYLKQSFIDQHKDNVARYERYRNVLKNWPSLTPALRRDAFADILDDFRALIDEIDSIKTEIVL
jgi:hypothetical protein